MRRKYEVFPMASYEGKTYQYIWLYWSCNYHKLPLKSVLEDICKTYNGKMINILNIKEPQKKKLIIQQMHGQNILSINSQRRK